MNQHKKLNLAILMGGQSSEHEVSLCSAKNVWEAVDKKKYKIILLGIDKKGTWFVLDKEKPLLNADNPKTIKLNLKNAEKIVLIPDSQGNVFSLKQNKIIKKIDVVFPILHGTLGEDGTVQGLLKLINLAFVGADVLGSAIAMDKDVSKRLLQVAKIPVAKFLVFRKNDKLNYTSIIKKIKSPFFIKPANAGSSVGISKVKNQQQFNSAVKKAFEHDNKILIEEFISGREIECSVLGNNNPKVSLPGEIIPQHEFYSYEAKYLDQHGAKLIAPAKLPQKIIKEIQNLALQVYQTLECRGMARVDFFLKANNKIFINEINTIPGFTAISMYPKLWQKSGLSYTKLIDKLINLALE